jgi:nitroimidazol reductase NimA-like FMN-containing flavoprotein (pyridoxamine 5'-phosphate oxidase superfamily)
MTLYYNKSRNDESGTGLPGNGRVLETTVRRHPERGAYDRETVDAILDEGLVGHLGFVSDDQPYVIPMLYARREDTLYLHGAPASRVLGALGDGVHFSFTVTLVDGLVLARSAFRHSLNYRSVVVIGAGRAVSDTEEKLVALEALVDHVLPGRPDEVRGPSEAELKVTDVIALGLDYVSAKVRTGPPVDNRADLSLPVWAGVVPLRLEAGEPIPDPACSVSEPPELRSYRRGNEQ